MAAYRRVYDSRHLQADCQEPGSAPVTEYGLPLPFLPLATHLRARQVQSGMAGSPVALRAGASLLGRRQVKPVGI